MIHLMQNKLYIWKMSDRFSSSLQDGRPTCVLVVWPQCTFDTVDYNILLDYVGLHGTVLAHLQSERETPDTRRLQSPACIAHVRCGALRPLWSSIIELSLTNIIFYFVFLYNHTCMNIICMYFYMQTPMISHIISAVQLTGAFWSWAMTYDVTISFPF